MNRKLLVKSATVLSGILLILLLGFFAVRNSVLHTLLGKISTKLKNDYQMTLTVEESGFRGFTGVMMRGVSLVPDGGDTLLHLDSVWAEPSFSSLITGNVRIKSLYTENAELSIRCHDGTCNYSGFLKHRKMESDTIRTEKNYASFLNRLLRQAFNLAPQQAELKNIRFSFRNDTMLQSVTVPSFLSSSKQLEGTLRDDSTQYQWKWSGHFSQRDETFDISVFPVSDQTQSLPFLLPLVGASCSFDTLHLALNSMHYGKGLLETEGHFSIENFCLRHKKISDDTVRVPHATFDYHVSVNKNSISLDSSSSVVLDKMRISPYASLSNGESKIYTLKVQTDKTPASDFFRSLPEGMFDVVRGIEADGSLQYTLQFKLDSSQPDSVFFDSSVKKEKFRIRKFGDSNLLMMNGEFIHTVYEHDRFLRSFPVGLSNPAFTPLDQISIHFRNAVLTSEDGSFFYHNGFNESAFRKSIATNFKAGKFVRGGSTISMQLVKNVFLTRKKTIARKAEEALIVWLIESNRLCSKDRMYEVYLNIIELGPGIYGIGEAAPFYFSKQPSELSLQESIFLASLLPHPKWFRYSFDKSGQLKPYFADYYRVVSNFLLRKNLISQEEHDALVPVIELKGPAREMVVPSDTIPEDVEEGEN
ncbi:MAG TPA: biosynthetic peptidoglycan transglycosylase [Bacteroidia bacterium]|nr:biosynthetic peptidoglycan transglycosylase [Bacteroidia bacterium]